MKINANNFNPGTRIFLRGKVAFSHISRLTTDDERNAENERKAANIKKKNGSNARTFTENNNYSYITLSDIQAPIVFESKTEASDAVKQLAKDFISERSYQNKAGSWCYNAMSKNPILPTVLVRNEDGNTVYEKQVNCRFIDAKNDYGPSNVDREFKRLDGELARGLDVTIELRVFDSKKGNNGMALDRVIVNEPLKLYRSKRSGGIDAGLAAALNIAGISQPPVDEKVTYTEAPTDTTEIGDPDPVVDPWDSSSETASSGNVFNEDKIDDRFIGAGEHNPKKGPF